MTLKIGVAVDGKLMITLEGDPLSLLVFLRDEVVDYGDREITLSFGPGQLEIPAGQSLDDAIRGAHEELQDPDLVFDDPAEEARTRLVVRNLYLALMLDTTDLVVEQIEEIEAGDHSEDAGARYDRYDELKEGESYN